MSISQTTNTITAPAVVHVLLHPAEAVPKPLPQQTVQSILVKLGAILVKHGNKNDLLSINLMISGHTFMTYVVANIRQPFDDLLKGSIDKIEGIRKTLQNPHGTKMLQDPWLVDGTATWEKLTVEEFRQYAVRFAGKNIQAVPHEFAKEVIDWIQALPLPEETETLLLSQAANPEMLSRELVEYRCYMGYESMINQTLTMRQTLQQKLVDFEKAMGQVRHLEEVKKVLEEENVREFERLQKVLDRQEQNGLQQTAELERSLAAVSEQQKQTVTMLQRINDEAMTTLRHVQSQLREANIQLNTQQQQIINLCNQLNSCYAQLGHLQNELNNQGSCSIQ